MLFLSSSLAEKRIIAPGGTPPGGWNPGDYGLPLYWYDVSQETAFADTDPIGTLRDWTGANHAVNAVSDATRPNYDEDAFGTGKPGAVFDADGGNLDVLNLTSDITFAGDFTIVGVVKANSVDSVVMGNDTVDTRLDAQAASAVIRLHFNGGSTISSPIFSMPNATDKYFFSWTRTSNEVNERVMLGDEFVGTTTYSDTGVFNTIGNSPGSSLPADITIGELVAYPAVLTTAQQESMYWTLANKWALIGPRVTETFAAYTPATPITETLNDGTGWGGAWGYGTL